LTEFTLWEDALTEDIGMALMGLDCQEAWVPHKEGGVHVEQSTNARMDVGV